jgi:polyhydroxyalkanoate synthesis regulator phasin
MKTTEIKSKLEEKIRDLEKEKETLLEEIQELKEVAELHEKANILESEVNKLREEAKALKEQIPSEILSMMSGENISTEKETSSSRSKLRKTESYSFDDEESECNSL